MQLKRGDVKYYEKPKPQVTTEQIEVKRLEALLIQKQKQKLLEDSAQTSQKKGGIKVLGASTESETRKEIKRIQEQISEMKHRMSRSIIGRSGDVGDDVSMDVLEGMGVNGMAGGWEAAGNMFAF